MDFGKRLRELREGKEMPQDKLAETLRVSKSSISMWERGLRTPELETFEAIADYFNVNMDYLKGKSDIKRPENLVCEDEGNYNGVERYLNMIHDKPGLRALLDSTDKLTEDDLNALVKMIDTFKGDR